MRTIKGNLYIQKDVRRTELLFKEQIHLKSDITNTYTEI